MAEREPLEIINSPGGRGHVTRYRLASGFVEDNDVVVDMACGIGYGSYLLSATGLGMKVIQVDLLPVEERVKLFYPTVQVLADLNEWEIDFPFDIGVSFETIEHVEDYPHLLKELKKARKWVICSVPVVPTKHFNEFHKHDFASLELIDIFEDDEWELYQVLGQPSELAEIYVFKNRSYDESIKSE